MPGPAPRRPSTPACHVTAAAYCGAGVRSGRDGHARGMERYEGPVVVRSSPPAVVAVVIEDVEGQPWEASGLAGSDIPGSERAGWLRVEILEGERAGQVAF